MIVVDSDEFASGVEVRDEMCFRRRYSACAKRYREPALVPCKLDRVHVHEKCVRSGKVVALGPKDIIVSARRRSDIDTQPVG
jgi:hypothetical protein